MLELINVINVGLAWGGFVLDPVSGLVCFKVGVSVLGSGRVYRSLIGDALRLSVATHDRYSPALSCLAYGDVGLKEALDIVGEIVESPVGSVPVKTCFSEKALWLGAGYLV